MVRLIVTKDVFIFVRVAWIVKDGQVDSNRVTG